MSRWQAPLAFMVAAAVMAASVTMGMRLPGDGLFPDLARRGVFVIGPALGPLAPLAQTFVDRVLGPHTTQGADPTRREPAVERLAERGRPPSGTGSERTRVDHDGSRHQTPASAYEVASVPFSASTHTDSATQEAPGDCAASGSGVWYRYRAERTSGLLASTYGSGQPTTVGVYTEVRQGETSLKGCDTDAAGNAQVSFAATKGEVYLFRVATFVGGGRLAFNLDRVGETEIVSLRSDGAQTNQGTLDHEVSGDGRFVAFMTTERLANNDDNGVTPLGTFDIYLRDREKRTTTLVSVAQDGTAGNDKSEYLDISVGGRFVAFTSLASDIVVGDTNEQRDVFLRDLATSRTERVSLSSSGEQGMGVSYSGLGEFVAVSDDGRHVVFTSQLTGLAPDDPVACAPAPSGSANFRARCRQLFARDVLRGTTTRLSVSDTGTTAPGDFGMVDMSPDGRFVVFTTTVALIAEDANGEVDVYIHDRDSDADGEFDEKDATRVELISAKPDGRAGSGASGGQDHRGHATVSADGRYVAFVSKAFDLVPTDLDPGDDVFLRDRVTGTTTLVSGPQGDRAVDYNADHSTISADGRYVAFASSDQVASRFVYVWDRTTGLVVSVGLSTKGEQANGPTGEPQLAANGRHVVFASTATNLVEGDDDHDCRSADPNTLIPEPGRCSDIFIHVLPAER